MFNISDCRPSPWRAALCGLALTACADAGFQWPDAEAEPPAPTVSAPPPEAAAPPRPEPKRPAEKPIRHAALPPEGRPDARAPVLEPRMLVGLDREQIALLLGAPGAVREQPPATVWSYRIEGCALNVFFYPDVKTREMRALAYDVLAGSETEQAKNACFAAIRARPRE